MGAPQVSNSLTSTETRPDPCPDRWPADWPERSAAVSVTHVGRVFQVERLQLPPEADGTPGMVRDVVRHPGAVTVIAVREDGVGRTPTLVLVRNRRVAVARWLLEFCAGKLERGEDPALAAARELEEETGYTASHIEKVGEFFTSPGFADEIMHVFVATGLRPVPQRLEPGEVLEVVEMPEESLVSAIARGEILDGKTLGAYLLWSMKRGIASGGSR